MSGTTQYIVAKRGDVAELADHGWPVETWPGCFGLKFFGPDDLVPLYAIVRGGPGSREDFPELAFGERAWMYGLPEDLVAALAAADDETLAGFATAWAARLATAPGPGHPKPDELWDLLRELRALAGRSMAAGEPVFLWHSLPC